MRPEETDMMKILPVGLALVVRPWTAEAATYGFTQAGSSVKFFNKASLHGIDGTAKSFSGSLDTEAGTGKLSVSTANMTTHLGPRDTKMHEFCLETDKYPTITYAVSSIDGGDALNAGQGAGTVTLKGTLTIRDVSKPVAIKTSYSFGDNGLSLSGRHDFKWTDFNVPDPSIIISRLYPEMNVQFKLQAKPSQ